MKMTQYTTPTFTLGFSEEDLDLTEAAAVFVTFRSGAYSVTKTGEELTVGEKQITVQLSQLETSQMDTQEAEVQVNWTDGEGGRKASNIVRVLVEKNLMKEIVADGDSDDGGAGGD